MPAFDFDGEAHTEITAEPHSLTVAYGGWCCRYTTDGEIIPLAGLAPNRNGHYRAFAVTGADKLSVRIEIVPQKQED